MNLASILNLTALNPALPSAPTGAAPAENALLAEFAALLGLAGVSASGGKDLPVADGKELPELPIELPIELPLLLLALPQMQLPTAELPVAPTAPQAPPTTAHATNLRLVPAPLIPSAPLLADLPEGTPVPAAAISPGQPAPPLPFEVRPALPQVLVPVPVPIQLQVKVALPVPIQQQVKVALPVPIQQQVKVALPVPIQQQLKEALPVQVHAQVQAATVLVEQPDPTSQQPAVAALAAPLPSRRTAEVAPGVPVPTLAEHSDVLAETARVAPAPVAAPTAVLADAPRTASANPIAPTVITTPAADRHDFSAIVDRLTEARELARPGRAAMQLTHRDFGAVSVQFDMAGPALKVALTSPDAGFAPAAEAALSERPVAAMADSARSDTAGQRFEQSAAQPSSSFGPAAQNDGQRADHNARQSAPRHPPEQVRGQSPAAREGDDETAARRARDGSLFA